MSNKTSKLAEFLNKVDRPWGMSKQELVQLQQELAELKAENERLKAITADIPLDRLKEICRGVR